MDEKKHIEKKIDELIKKMSLEEKIELLSGKGNESFETVPNERLGIPVLKMADGPLGVRWGRAMAFPSGVAMASTWNVNLIEELGKALAQEVIHKGRNVILGPCVNIARILHGGRNFESFGEDPHLAARMTVAYIEGVQSKSVAATVKHFACNNQEFERRFIDVNVDERTLNEIYLPAFKAAVKEANVLTVMSAYNKLNGYYCSENDDLLNKKLKEEWEFDGLVMSDWGAVHSSVKTAISGLDLEMPNGKYLNYSNLIEPIKNGEVKESVIDDKARRILRIMFKLGLFDKENNSKNSNSVDVSKISYQTASEGIVLLKNEKNILPLNVDKIKSIAVIGTNALLNRTGGGGSSMVAPAYSISPLKALKNKFGEKVKINYEIGVKLNGDVFPAESPSLYLYEYNDEDHGLLGEYFDNMELRGKPVATRVDQTIDFEWGYKSPIRGIGTEVYSVRWSGFIKVLQDSDYLLEIINDDGVRLFIDDKLVVNDWESHGAKYNSCEVNLEANKKHKITIEYYQNKGDAVIKFGWKSTRENLFNDAVKAASKSDAVIVFAGTSPYFETEGRDRESLELPNNQDELIEAVAKVNKNVVVVLVSGSPVLMTKWIDKVAAVVQAWFGGSEAGNAIADILLGRQNPSGKLPMTFPERWEDCSAYNTYKSESGTAHYSDGIFVGYRHFDKKEIEPRFPFGHGLSYTNFIYSNLTVESKSQKKSISIKVNFEIKNSGKIEGAEVAQLYIKKVNSKIVRAVKELKAFHKVNLKPSETRRIEFTLTEEAFSYFDVDKNNWNVETGEYSILIGSSSRDIRSEGKLVL